MQVVQIIKSKGDRVVTARPDATVAEVAAVLKRERIGAIVITAEDGSIAGIVSERDIVHALPDHGPGALDKPVADLMSRNVVTSSPDQTVDEIRRQMTERRIRHIPVLDGGKLAGIISIGDVVKNRLEELEAESNQLRQYIASG